MGKYIPPEKMTVEQIQANLDERFRAWNRIAQNGCSDPGWPDGVNMNLVRNHIIYYYGLLHERQAAQVQISLFDIPARTPERPIPPEGGSALAPSKRFARSGKPWRWPDLLRAA